MEPRLSYALVGLFALTLGAAAVFAVLWLAGIGPEGDNRFYLVYLEESVAGLTLESAVKYQGVEVGRVREIALDPNDAGRVRLRLAVHPKAPVSADTRASLATQGMTGLVYFIELRGGGPGSPALEPVPGEDDPVIASEPSLGARLQRQGFALLAELQGAAGEFRATLAEARLLLGEDNRAALAALLRDAARTAGHLARASDRLETYLERLDPVLDEAARAIAALPGLTDRAAGTLQALDEAAGEIRQAARDLDQILIQATPGLLSFSRDSLPQVDPLLRGLRTLTARLERLAADLERNPGLLLQGRARRPGPGEGR